MFVARDFSVRRPGCVILRIYLSVSSATCEVTHRQTGAELLHAGNWERLIATNSFGAKENSKGEGEDGKQTLAKLLFQRI